MSFQSPNIVTSGSKKGFKIVVHGPMSDGTVSDSWSVTISGMDIRTHPSTLTLVEHDTPQSTRYHCFLPHIRPNTDQCRSLLIRTLLYIPRALHKSSHFKIPFKLHVHRDFCDYHFFMYGMTRSVSVVLAFCFMT